MKKKNLVTQIPHIDIFAPKDESRYDYINDEVVVDLCGFLLENTDFLVYAGAIIDECTHVSQLSNCEALTRYYNESYGDDLLEEEAIKNSTFLSLIFSLYSNHSDEGEIANARGALLERLTLLLILDRYMYRKENFYLPIKKESLYNHCKLGLDCKVSVTHANWITKDPIDIAGWNQDNLSGEFYECKIKINKIESSDEDILSNLWKACQDNSYIKAFRVGIVTFSSTKGIKCYFDYIKDTSRSNNKILLYGRDNLGELQNEIKVIA